MLVVKSPLRVSLFGGGTDLPEYYRQHSSIIISFAIDKHIYLIHNSRPTGGYRISYSLTEELDDPVDAKHTLIQSLAYKYGLGYPCTLSIVGDLPKGTGLGSSSALSVALVRLMSGDVSRDELIKDAFELELRTSPNIGIQDFLPAVYGGFNIYRIDKDGQVSATPMRKRAAKIIKEYGMLIYTGRDRSANDVLANLSTRDAKQKLHDIHSLAGKAAVCDWTDMDEVINLLNESWFAKSRIAGVVDTELQNQYWAAISAGAMAGKLCGAGQGGCWFFLVPYDRRNDVTDALNLREIQFAIEPEAVREYTI